jgi:hypothetical protein
MAGDGIFHVIEGLAKQGMSIDVIGGFSNINNLEHRYHTSALSTLGVDSGISIKPSVSSKLFTEILMNYDFALLAHNTDFFDCQEFIGHTNNHIEYCGSARVASYVQAGLPIIMGTSLKCNLERLSGTSFPLIFKKEEFSQIAKQITLLKRSNYRDSVLRDREKFTIKSILNDFKIFADSILKFNN